MIDLITGLIPHFIRNLYYFVFIASKAGPAHQFVKNLRGRKTVNKKKKISTHYRGAEKLFHWAEFFWGLSTSIGIFITIGNFLALIFPGLILWQIWKERRDTAVLAWIFICGVFVSANTSLLIFAPEKFLEMSQILGYLMIVFCIFSLWGIGENILLIHKEKIIDDQSFLEIGLKLIKDPIGIAFCFFSGIFSHYPLAIALALRGSMRSIHFIVYWRALCLQRLRIMLEKTTFSSHLETRRNLLLSNLNGQKDLRKTNYKI